MNYKGDPVRIADIFCKKYPDALAKNWRHPADEGQRDPWLALLVFFACKMLDVAVYEQTRYRLYASTLAGNTDILDAGNLTLQQRDLHPALVNVTGADRYTVVWFTSCGCFFAPARMEYLCKNARDANKWWVLIRILGHSKFWWY